MENSSLRGQGLVGVEDALGVHESLHGPHEAYGSVGLAVVEVSGLHEPYAVLGTDAPLALGRVLVEERLDELRHLSAVLRCRYVQVNIPCSTRQHNTSHK